MMVTEVKHWYNVQVTSKTGKQTVVSQLAYSKWHAIDLVYTRLRDIQPNRSLYKITKQASQ